MRKRSEAEIRRVIRHPESAPGLPGLGPGAHHIHDYLDLVQALGAQPELCAPHIPIQPGESEAFATKFGLDQIRRLQVPVFGMNPGAEYGPAKRWPLEHFIEVGSQAQRITGCCWLIFGGAQDERLASAVTGGIVAGQAGREAPVVNLAGKTTLRELCVGLSLCSVVLTNDTGPMHVAAAVGARVVAAFGSTSPELTGPGMPGESRHIILQGRVPCAPCFRRSCPIDLRCLRQIGVQQMLEAVVNPVAASTGKR
jgi:heptosyltransferase-2